MNKQDNVPQVKTVEAMEPTLVELGFVNISDKEFTGFYKTYKGFTLFVARNNDHDERQWHASITIGQLEISIPLNVDAFWVYGFNEENNG